MKEQKEELHGFESSTCNVWVKKEWRWKEEMIRRGEKRYA